MEGADPRIKKFSLFSINYIICLYMFLISMLIFFFLTADALKSYVEHTKEATYAF